MSKLHQEATPLFALANGHVRRLRLREAHRLQLASGRLWLTLDGRLGAPADDVLLQAGESWVLPPGREAVLEALPLAGQAGVGAARFDLLLNPDAA